jgi:hypothetical protein
VRKKIILFCLLLLPTFLTGNDQEVGEKLVYKLWNDIKHHKSRVTKYISPAFQETIPAAQIRRNAKQELEQLPNISKFNITSLKIKREDDVIVATYFLQADEIAGDQIIVWPPSIRLSAWKKVGGKWTWIAHQGGD